MNLTIDIGCSETLRSQNLAVHLERIALLRFRRLPRHPCPELFIDLQFRAAYFSGRLGQTHDTRSNNQRQWSYMELSLSHKATPKNFSSIGAFLKIALRSLPLDVT
jgi:hypothetical protein